MTKFRIGDIEIASAENDRIVLREKADSFDGTLELTISVNGDLQCTWRKGKRLTNKVSAHATMARQPG
jgi:hypothetical protein